MNNCDECDNDATRAFCEQCIADLRDADSRTPIEERYTEEQHERATTLLSEQDEIECVISDYEQKLVIVHTPYVSSDVVGDFCEQFGYHIQSFGPRWENGSRFPCSAHHGSMFEIVLSYDYTSDAPMPIRVPFVRETLDELDGNDKQF